jgi:hypothetical protein
MPMDIEQQVKPRAYLLTGIANLSCLREGRANWHHAGPDGELRALIIPISAAALVAANLAVMLGAILQATTGLGAGLIIVPLIALVTVDFVPGPIVLASMALSTLMAWRGRHDIQVHGMKVLLPALLLGIALGALSISSIPPQRAGLAFGLLVLIAVAVSVVTPDLQRRGPLLAGGGVLSGFMGALSGIGAPILGLIYQHEEPRVLRATLGFIFTVSSVAILACLHLAGRFGSHEAWLGVCLVPGYVLGYLVAPPLARALDRGRSRHAVLIISTLSALMLIARSL